MRYKRVSRRNLPANVSVKRARVIGPNQQQKREQRGSGLLSSASKLGSRLFTPGYITKDIDIGSTFLNSALGRNKIEEGIKEIPAIYNAGVKRIENEKIKKNRIWQTTLLKK